MEDRSRTLAAFCSFARGLKLSIVDPARIASLSMFCTKARPCSTTLSIEITITFCLRTEFMGTAKFDMEAEIHPECVATGPCAVLGATARCLNI